MNTPPLPTRETDWDAPINVMLADVHSFKAYISWSQRTVGFGQLSLSAEAGLKEIKLTGDLEGMNKDWVRKALYAMIDSIVDAIPPPKDRYDPQRYVLDVSVPYPSSN
jgi:hypothetical protein